MADAISTKPETTLEDGEYGAIARQDHGPWAIEIEVPYSALYSYICKNGTPVYLSINPSGRVSTGLSYHDPLKNGGEHDQWTPINPHNDSVSIYDIVDAFVATGDCDQIASKYGNQKAREALDRLASDLERSAEFVRYIKEGMSE